MFMSREIQEKKTWKALGLMTVENSQYIDW